MVPFWPNIFLLKGLVFILCFRDTVILVSVFIRVLSYFTLFKSWRYYCVSFIWGCLVGFLQEVGAYIWLLRVVWVG